MDIQQLIGFDQDLLLKLNGSDSLFWDGFMWLSTNMFTWMPLAVVLLYVILKNNKIKNALIIIVLLGIVITLADQISSGICKPLFARFRPTQDPELMYQIDIVNGYGTGNTCVQPREVAIQSSQGSGVLEQVGKAFALCSYGNVLPIRQVFQGEEIIDACIAPGTCVVPFVDEVQKRSSGIILFQIFHFEADLEYFGVGKIIVQGQSCG